MSITEPYLAQLNEKLAEYNAMTNSEPPIDAEGFQKWYTAAKDKLGEIETLRKEAVAQTSSGFNPTEMVVGTIDALLEAASEALSAIN
jgi:hypothetical protein